MKTEFLLKQTGRREMLRGRRAGGRRFAGAIFSTALAAAVPGTLRGAVAYAAQGTAPAADPLAAVRAQIGAMPIQTHKLRRI